MCRYTAHVVVFTSAFGARWINASNGRWNCWLRPIQTRSIVKTARGTITTNLKSFVKIWCLITDLCRISWRQKSFHVTKNNLMDQCGPMRTNASHCGSCDHMWSLPSFSRRWTNISYHAAQQSRHGDRRWKSQADSSKNKCLSLRIQTRQKQPWIT